jgi:hypothetical protein
MKFVTRQPAQFLWAIHTGMPSTPASIRSISPSASGAPEGSRVPDGSSCVARTSLLGCEPGRTARLLPAKHATNENLTDVTLHCRTVHSDAAQSLFYGPDWGAQAIFDEDFTPPKKKRTPASFWRPSVRNEASKRRNGYLLPLPGPTLSGGFLIPPFHRLSNLSTPQPLPLPNPDPLRKLSLPGRPNLS